MSMRTWWQSFAKGDAAEYAEPAAVAKAPAAAHIDTSIVSLDRTLYGFMAEGFPRPNPDDLVGKKGLNIYARMRLDEQVKAAVTFKRDAIISRGWTFEFDEESKLSDTEKDKRKKVVQKIVRKMPGTFVDALNQIATGREFGFSLTEKVYQKIECDGKQYVGIKALLGRDPCTFNFYTDKFGSLVKCQQEAGAERIDIDLAKFVHYVHNPEFDHYFGRSDLREAHRSWYFKDTMIRFWGLYMEKLGGGVIVGSIGADSNIQANSAQYDQLTAAFAQMKASASIVLPKGVTAQVVFPQSSDAFEKACTWHDLSIAKALLVPNLAGVSHTGQTGAYSQAQSQLEAFAWTLAADAARMEACIDEQLFADLATQNWGDDEYPCFKFKPLSGEMLRWIVDTWCKLVTAGTVIPTELDEARLREILEMPPRDENTEPLVDPNEEAQREHELAVAETGVDAGMAGEGEEAEEGAPGKNPAAPPARGAAGKAKAVEKAVRRRLRAMGVDPSIVRFEWDESKHPREKDGKFGDGAGESDALKSAVAQRIGNGMTREQALRDIASSRSASGSTKTWLEAKDRVRDLDAQKSGIARDRKSAKDGQVYEDGAGWSIKDGSGSWKIETGLVVRDGSKHGQVSSVDRNAKTARIDWDKHDSEVPIGAFNKYDIVGQENEVNFTRRRSFASLTPAQARIAIASSRERVDFAVIEHKQRELSTSLAADLASIVARAVSKELGTEADLKALTDENTDDIGQWQLPATAVGRLKVTAQKALAEAWAQGSDAASAEVRRTKKVVHIRFADLRGKAASYFESNSFKMAGDVSDRARSITQQELLTSVKIGRSPAQTRTAIWERLVAKGLSSQEAVRSVETDAAVNDALDELWKDSVEEAMAYLDTVARTNLFSAMNEARYAEFTDPALQDFVVAFRYSAILDERTTDICTSLHDSVYESGNPLWDEYRPPNHFNCRSLLVPITAVDVEDGLWNGEESDEPTVEPQEGFGV